MPPPDPLLRRLAALLGLDASADVRRILAAIAQMQRDVGDAMATAARMRLNLERAERRIAELQALLAMRGIANHHHT